LNTPQTKPTRALGIEVPPGVLSITDEVIKLGMQLGVGIESDEDRRFAKLLQSPKGILDWIAVPNFLAARS
jgi:hypothetical protein